MPFAPPIPDRSGRGALCARIELLAQEWMRLLARGEREEAGRVERRLDQARAEFRRLYGAPEYQAEWRG